MPCCHGAAESNMKKERYLAEIIPLIKSEGLRMSMETIAQKIGVTKKTLYNQFISKDRLIDECLEMTALQYRKALEVMDDVSLPVRERLHQGIAAMRTHFSDFSRVLMQDLVDLYPGKARDGQSRSYHYIERKFIENIKTGIREGVYRDDIDAELVSRYITFSSFYYLEKRIFTEGECTIAHYLDQIEALFLNGLLK